MDKLNQLKHNLTNNKIMKKSQLRKIIRESIKELMIEQDRGKTNYSGTDGKSGVTLIPPTQDQLNQSRSITTQGDGGERMLNEGHMNPCPSNRRYIRILACPNSYHWTGNHIPGPWHAGCALIDGQTPNQSHVGTIIDHGPANGSYGPNNYEVVEVVGAGYPAWGSQFHTTPYCCADPVQVGQGGCIGTIPCTVYGCTDSTAMNYNPTILPNCDDNSCVYTSQFGCTDSTASNYDPLATIDDGSCITTSSCDPSAWSNHANWTTTFTNTVTNANNPCNFLNNKIAQFTNQIPNVGPVWANQLQCKLDLCNQLHASNNC